MRASHLIAGSLALLSLLPLRHVAGPVHESPDGKNLSLSMEFDGIERSYSLYVPAGDHEKEKYPLVIALHGGGGTAKGLIRIMNNQFNKIADREGVYVAYPEAVRRHWNEGRDMPLSYAHRTDVNDVGFIESMIKSLLESHPIDQDRIFVTGMSNGGLMAYRLGCSLPDLVKAIAPVSASMPTDILSECNDSQGTGLMVLNGTEDPQMPYDGGIITVFGVERGEVLSTDATIDYWLKANGCPLHSQKKMLPDTARQDETTVTKYLYSKCNSDVKVALYRVEGGGHTWPGGRQYLREDRIGKTTRDINACEEIWSFFAVPLQSSPL